MGMKEAKRLDRVSAEIQVGGDLSSGAVDALCQAITAQGVSWAHGDALFAPESAADLLEVVDEAGHLHLYCDAAAYGMFSELEEHLTALGLPFDRKSEAGAGFAVSGIASAVNGDDHVVGVIAAVQEYAD